MIRYAVVFSHEARRQLGELHRHIAEEASPAVAARYAGAVIETCEGLALFPHRGTPRPDIRPDLQGRTTIAYRLLATRREVVVLGIFHGGRDVAAALDESSDR